jgi:hypothetical protein
LLDRKNEKELPTMKPKNGLLIVGEKKILPKNGLLIVVKLASTFFC